MDNQSNALKQKELELKSTISREKVYSGKAIDLYVDKIKLADDTKKFEIVSHPTVVAIVPINENKEIIFIKQWRRASNEILIELPAGTLEKNETTLECAKRELQEEIKYASDNLTEIGGFYTTPGFCDEYIHLYIAKKLYKSSKDQDLDEGIDIFPINEKDVSRMILDGKIKDAKTIAGFFYYKLWKNQ